MSCTKPIRSLVSADGMAVHHNGSHQTYAFNASADSLKPNLTYLFLKSQGATGLGSDHKPNF